MSNDPGNASVYSPDRLQEILRDQPWHLRFPQGLERDYALRQLPARLRAMQLGVLVAIPLYLLTCLIEFLYLPAMLQNNLPARMVVIGLLLLILILLNWSVARQHAEKLAVSFTLLLSGAQIPIALASPEPYQPVHFLVMILPLIYLGTVTRAGFLYTLFASLLTLGAMAAAILSYSDMDGLQAAFTLQFTLSATILLLISNYIGERVMRRHVLQSWLLRHHRKALEEERARESVPAGAGARARIASVEAELQRRVDLLAELPVTNGDPAALPSAHLVLRYSFALLLLKMDDEEEFTRLYGEKETDFCVTTMARIVRKHLSGPEDVAVRLEGNTLALLIQGVSASDAESMGQRILRDVTALGIPHYGTEWRENVTASCGVLHSSDFRGRDPRTLLMAAEQTLEEAMRLGGDRCLRHRDFSTDAVG